MFENLIKRLTGAPSADPVSTTDARLAMAALLVRVARADHEYAPTEVATIDALLMTRYGLSLQESDELRTEAEELEAVAPDTVRFTRLIKEVIPYEESNAVTQDLWSVVLADGHRDMEEDSFLRMVVKLLGVNDRDSASARQRARKG